LKVNAQLFIGLEEKEPNRSATTTEEVGWWKKKPFLHERDP
jgi:hypothetical protein